MLINSVNTNDANTDEYLTSVNSHSVNSSSFMSLGYLPDQTIPDTTQINRCMESTYYYYDIEMNFVHGSQCVAICCNE